MKKLLTFAAILCISISSLLAQGYKIGDKAEDFSLLGVDKKMHSLKDMKDAKGFIIIFTCNHCPYAKLYEDRIIALQKEFGPQGYQVIAINPNDPKVQAGDSFEEMIVRAKEKGFNFPYLFDDGQLVYPKFGATKTPHVYLLDNNLIVKYIGAIDDNAKDPDAVEERFLANAIKALQEGKKIDPETTKAIGCSIKVKK